MPSTTDPKSRNHRGPHAARRLKSLLVRWRLLGPRVAERRILSGPFRGQRHVIDLDRQTQLLVGLWERETYPWLRRFVGEAVSAVDVGSGEGELVVHLLRQSHIHQVVAVDPAKTAATALDANLQANGLAGDARLTSHRALLGSESTQRTLTLDEVAAHLPRPCFVKIDVDGPEVAILEGAAELLADPQVSWLIEVHGRDLERRCCEILTGAGLQTEVIDNARWRLLIPEERPVAHNRWVAAYSSAG